MIVISFATAGAVLGALSARRNRGNGLDIAQYAAAGAIGAGVLGLLVTVLIHRAAL